tara:strand:+ start:5221 stop:5820 length:600 start_codon:yes stop_codon:yes gene_type:complete
MAKKKIEKKIAELKSKEVSLSRIKPYWRNPRNNDNAVEVVKKSMDEFGYLQPIVVDENNVIIVGHTRYRGLLQLGYTHASVAVFTMSDEKAKKYRIADNSSGDIATFDTDALIQEMREIGDIEDFSQYFDDSMDVEKLLSDSVGITSYKEVTENDIDKKSEQMDGKFEGMNEQIDSGLLLVTCPHCAEDFHIRKDETKI